MIESRIRVVPVFFFCLILGACGGGGPATLPDAPPPWQEVPSNGEEATPPRPSPFGGTNPRLGNPTAPTFYNQPDRHDTIRTLLSGRQAQLYGQCLCQR